MDIIIHNPLSRTYDYERVLRLSQYLQMHGYPVTEMKVEDPLQIPDLVQQALAFKPRMIIGAGGDGTLRLLAESIGRSQVPLAILPMGTANVLSRALEYPEDELELFEMLLQAPARNIYPSRITLQSKSTHDFLLMASAGLDAAVCRDVSKSLKHYLGEGAYALQTLKRLFQELEEFDVHVHRDVGIGHTFIALNSPFYGGLWKLGESASLESEEIEGVLIRNGVQGILMTLAALGREQIPTGQSIRRSIASRFCLHKSGVPLQIDGDYMGTSPCIIERLTEPISIIAPPKFSQNQEK